jgi:hypothetical protein
MNVRGQFHVLASFFLPREGSFSIHWIWGWLALRVGLDVFVRWNVSIPAGRRFLIVRQCPEWVWLAHQKYGQLREPTSSRLHEGNWRLIITHSKSIPRGSSNFHSWPQLNFICVTDQQVPGAVLSINKEYAWTWTWCMQVLLFILWIREILEDKA